MRRRKQLVKDTMVLPGSGVPLSQNMLDGHTMGRDHGRILIGI